MGTVRQFQPASHVGDPITSREAEHAVTVSGTRGRQLDLVVTAVRRWPGMAAQEVASACGLDRYQTRRRLTDAKHAGLLRQGNPKVQAGGRRAMSWWPNDVKVIDRPVARGVIARIKDVLHETAPLWSDPRIDKIKKLVGMT